MDEYHTVDERALLVSKLLADMWVRFGKPTTPLSKSGEKLMNALIASWQEIFPQQYKDWLEERKEYQREEKSIKQQVKHHTGRSLASYPSYIYHMMKKLFPDFNPAERNNAMKIVKKWPMFRMANKV